MVRAIRVLTIPASGEGDDRADAALTEVRGQFLAVRGAAVHVAVVSRRRHAAVADFTCRTRLAQRGVADEHAEAGREGGDLCLRVGRRDIVHRDAALGTETLARELGHALVRPVAGSEVEDRGPVVREVFRERAAGARGFRGEIVRRRVHGGVEGIAPDDLVKMRRRYRAGTYQRVQTVDDELRATEAHHLQHSLAGTMLHEECKGESFPLHLGRNEMLPSVKIESLQ